MPQIESRIAFFNYLVILNGAIPFVMLSWDAYRGQLGANSVNNALHVTGILSLIFLFLSLLITPLMSIARYLTDRAWSGDIYFLIVAKTEQDLIFHDEIECGH